MRKRRPSDATGRANDVVDVAEIELPEWLDRGVWRDWCDDRRQRHKPITGRAAKLQVRMLEEYRQAGHDPNDVVRHSIACGYQGLYPPRREWAQGHGGAPGDRVARRLETAALLTGAKPTTAVEPEIVDVQAKRLPE